MDVKSLYPSLNIEHTIKVVCEMFESSTVDIDGIDFEEISFYIAVTMNQDEINQTGLADFCPKRKATRGRRPKITGVGTLNEKEKRYAPYTMPDTSTFTNEIKRRMISTALSVALTFVMKNHVYNFNNELRKQREGGAIGLELTGLLARIFMIWWDRRFLQKCNENQVGPEVYKRYVDDSNLLSRPVEPGRTYNGTEIVTDRELEISDRNKPADEITMRLMCEIGNSIHESIQLTKDYPSNNPDNKIPILNLKVWTESNEENRTTVIYEHYRKEVSTKSTVHYRSAMGMKQKRSILTQELLTIMINCSPLLNETKRKEHINEYIKRLQFSGYNKEFRYDVYNAANKAYQKKVEESRAVIRPLHRPKSWRREEREAEKQEEKKKWYKRGGAESVIFIPCTPYEQLKKEYEQEIARSGFRIKVVEKSGTKIKDVLHRKDPFKKKQCERPDCFVCRSNGKGKGMCNKENVKYTITCTENCGRKDVYRGETSYSAYTRGKEQLEMYHNRNPSSALHNHCENEHQGNRVQFRMDITGTFHRDSTLRQISEGVDIEGTSQQRLMNTRSEWNSSLIPQCTVQRR